MRATKPAACRALEDGSAQGSDRATRAHSGPARASAQADPERVALECLGDERGAVALANVLDISARMAGGAAASGRSTQRRDQLAAAAKTARKLDATLRQIDPRTMVTVMGGHAVAGLLGDARAITPETGIPGATMTAPVFSRTPALVTEYTAFLGNLAALPAALERLAALQPADRRGAPSVADALMFAIEGLAHVWARYKGAPPHSFGSKRGDFGDLVHRTLETSAGVFSPTAVTTALRRFRESLREPAAEG